MSALRLNMSYYLAVGCILIAVSVVAYWPILNNTLVADDYLFALTFRDCPDCELTKLFTILSPFALRPVAVLTFLTQYSLFGLNPWPYHLFNVLLHAGTAFLLIYFLLLMGARKLTATVVALLFVVTPIAPEAVTWASGRSDVMALFFSMLALVLYGIYLTERQWMAFGGAMLATIAALLSKEQAFMLIIMFPAMEFIYGRQFFDNYAELSCHESGLRGRISFLSKSAWVQMTDHGFLIRQAMMLVIFLGSLLMHYAIMGRLGGYTDKPVFSLPNVACMRSTFRTLLSPLNDVEVSWGTIRAFRYYILALCFIGAVFVILRWRRTDVKVRKLFVMMVIFFIASLLPVFSMLFTSGIYNNLQDSRFLYSANLCFLSVMAIAVLEFSSRKWYLKAATLSLLILLIPLFAMGLQINNRPWQRAAAINYSIHKQIKELVPEPDDGATLVFMNLPIWKDAYVITGAFPETIRDEYKREDLEVIKVRELEEAPELGVSGYLFDYDQASGLLLLKVD